jgi:hypothetical protein
VNLQSAPGKLLIMYEPAGTMEALFREFVEARADGSQPTVDELKTLFRRHSCEYVRPGLAASSF